MIREIEVEDVGTVRLLNVWQEHRAGRVRGPNRPIARLAFSAGMSIQQFKRLPAEKQEEVRSAYLTLIGPGNG